jgi:hypothetical protein
MGKRDLQDVVESIGYSFSFRNSKNFSFLLILKVTSFKNMEIYFTNDN